MNTIKPFTNNTSKQALISSYRQPTRAHTAYTITISTISITTIHTIQMNWNT